MARTKNELADDRQLIISPDTGRAPLGLALWLGCAASILLVLLSWAGLAALFAWQGWPFTAWPFVTGPLVLWLALLIAPAFLKTRAGALGMLDAIVRTAEAYLQRAGWSIDLNKDGAIGHVQPVQQATQDVRPIIMTAGPNVKMIPDQAADHVGGADGLPLYEQLGPSERLKVWHLPNGEKIGEDELTAFVDGIFGQGWNRDTWTGQGMRREVYDGCLALLEQARIIEGRKKGFAGRLNCRNASQARRVLNLPGDPG
jgi:hypothetical protein